MIYHAFACQISCETMSNHAFARFFIVLIFVKYFKTEQILHIICSVLVPVMTLFIILKKSNRFMLYRFCRTYGIPHRDCRMPQNLRGEVGLGYTFYSLSFIVNFFGSFVSVFCFGIVIVNTPSLYSASASSDFIGWSKEIVLWYLP